MAALLPALSLILFCSTHGAAPEPVEREVYLMGTSFRIALYANDRAKAIVDLERAIGIVEQTENELSTWRVSSEISQLNRTDVLRPYAMSAQTCNLLMKVTRMVLMTGGAFDPAIGRLGELWKSPVPQTNQIDAALKDTGWRHLEFNGCYAVKKRPIALDTGAFGKGEAMDRVLQFAVQESLSPLVINFGGQIAVRGIKTKIRLADPLRREKPAPVTVAMEAGSISTSGQSVQPQHILDPRTGLPAPAFGSVTVWHERALDADILSTALFVMGPDEGFDWAAKNHVAACFFIAIRDHLQIRSTPEFEKLMGPR